MDQGSSIHTILLIKHHLRIVRICFHCLVSAALLHLLFFWPSNGSLPSVNVMKRSSSSCALLCNHPILIVFYFVYSYCLVARLPLNYMRSSSNRLMQSALISVIALMVVTTIMTVMMAVPMVHGIVTCTQPQPGYAAGGPECATHATSVFLKVCSLL
jgi:hypothetical protein